MKRGFFYTKGTDERIPYWVSEEQADKFATGRTQWQTDELRQSGQ
jgi:hypothetical protein